MDIKHYMRPDLYRRELLSSVKDCFLKCHDGKKWFINSTGFLCETLASVSVTPNNMKPYFKLTFSCTLNWTPDSCISAPVLVNKHQRAQKKAEGGTQLSCILSCTLFTLLCSFTFAKCSSDVFKNESVTEWSHEEHQWTFKWGRIFLIDSQSRKHNHTFTSIKI